MDLARVTERNINDVIKQKVREQPEREFPNLLLYRAVISLLNQ